MKMLYILNVANRFNSFAYTSYLAAKQLGIEFHIAGAWTDYKDISELRADEIKYGIKIHQIDFIRTPYDPRNIKAYKQIKKLIKEENIDFIHCNTPIGGVTGRLAGKKCNIYPVIYEAHGFHFYKGAPLLNWLIYYPVERWLAHYTDALITINKEDFDRAQKMRLRNLGSSYYVPGVGIDISRRIVSYEEKKEIRKSLNIPEKAIVLISVGDLNKNKNNSVIIEALKKIDNSNIHYIICGEGPLRDHLIKISNPIRDRVHFLGYRNDINVLMASSDIFVMPSFREGLSRSLMEAMVSGLPCVVSNIRGNCDLIVEGNGGFLCDPKDVNSFSTAITLLANDYNLRLSMEKENTNRIKSFDINASMSALKTIYSSLLC